VLKRDMFSKVERGRFRTDAGEVDAVLRRLGQVPWGAVPSPQRCFGASNARLRCRHPRHCAAAAVLLPTSSRARLDRWRRAFVEGKANDAELLDFLGGNRPEHL